MGRHFELENNEIHGSRNLLKVAYMNLSTNNAPKGCSERVAVLLPRSGTERQDVVQEFEIYSCVGISSVTLKLVFILLMFSFISYGGSLYVVVLCHFYISWIR